MRIRTVWTAILVIGFGAHQLAEAGMLQRIPTDRIRVEGEIGRRIEVTVENNLLKLDLDHDFLDPFRTPTAQGGYVGLGKTIDAFVRLAAHTQNPQLLERKRYLVAETISTQSEDGYIGMMAPEARLWTLWDIHEMAYLIYGLTMDHRFFGEDASLAAARKLADFILAGWHTHERSPGDGSITEYMAVTGLENALIALFQQTSDRKYLDYAADFRGLSKWDGPIVLGRWGPIQGHAYAYLCRSLAQLRLNQIAPQETLLAPTKRAMDFLLRDDGLAITGTCGQHECWHDTQEGAANLGETCATAYLLRWWDEQCRMEPKAVYGDLMERAIHNALFAAQSPDGRKIRYYAPFEGPRVYFNGDTYCCPCNFRRIIGELPQMIYYTGDGGLYVNLYTPAQATFSLAGQEMKVEQVTDYPHDAEVTLRISPEASATFTLHLRIPDWCADATVEVNGETAAGDIQAGAFFPLSRTWQPGDSVTLHLPMHPRLVAGRKSQAGRAAIMVGPLVFCLNPERNPDLGGQDLQQLTIDPATLSGPLPDDSVHPGGLACTVKAWRTTSWYPQAGHDYTLTLTEFPDPDGQAAYFHVPNPNDPALKPEPLLGE